MSIETIEQNFTETERAYLGEFEQCFKRVASGKHKDDWLEMIPGLTVLSNAAKAYANADERKGRAYNEMFGTLVLEHARKVSNRVSLRDIEAMKPAFSYLLWLSEKSDRLTILDAELEKLPLNRRIRINHPLSMYKLVKAVEDAAAQPVGEDASAKQEAAAKLLAEHDGEPTPTEEEMLKVLTRSVKKRGVNQTATALLGADFALFKDLAEALNREIRAARQDAKDLQRKSGSAAAAPLRQKR